MSEKEKCFIIMPITTPDTYIEQYRDGKEHFQHILDCLIIPAVNEAGYEAIPPKSQGSENIPADIIQNIENSNLVVCDLSTLNPNVFFEFGIRTSLNKPVCVIKDDLTENIPFDTNTINNHTYINTIDPWILTSEIKKMTAHLLASVEKSKGQNPLWRYFGMKSEAIGLSKNEITSDDKFDYLLNQIDSMKSQINLIHKSVNKNTRPKIVSNTLDLDPPNQSGSFVNFIYEWFDTERIKLDSFNFDSEGEGLSIKYRGDFDRNKKIKLYTTLREMFGDEITIRLHNLDDNQIESYG